MTVSLAAVFIPILFMGGHPRAAVPRVRRHDHGGDSDLRHRLGDADADAVQPLPASGVAARARGVRAADGARVRRDCCRLRVEPAAGAAPPAGDARRLRRRAGRARCRCSAIVPKGFIPDQDNDSLNINLRAAQGTSFYEMVDYVAPRRRRSSARIRTSTCSSRAPAADRIDEHGALQRSAEAAARAAA